jgi:hypothetical protein
VGDLSERNELAMYQCFSRKLSSHEAAPTDWIAVVQHYVSWSDEQTRIGHRSNDAHGAKWSFGRRKSPGKSWET